MLASRGTRHPLTLNAIVAAQAISSQMAAVYDRLARPAYGLIRRVVRDPAQSAGRIAPGFICLG
jgi:hypothetical protein